MSDKHKETGGNDKIDSYLLGRDIDGLYNYMQGKQGRETLLCNMLEIWSLEKAQGMRTIFYNVFSYEEAIRKYDIIDKIMGVIVHKQELSLPIIQFIEREISVWAMIGWTLTNQWGVRQIEALEAIGSFLKERHYDSGVIAVHEGICKKTFQKELSEALAHGDGYLALKLLAKISDSEQKEVLVKKAKDSIRQVEQRMQGRLYTPTNMEKIGEYYMIVDCWHDRVLYSRELCEIKDWSSLDSNLQHPHSICREKGIYAVENTEAGTVCFYKKKESFVKIGELPVGRRPHRILYDEKREMFWALMGESQEIFGIKVVNASIELPFRQKIEELQSSYVRSMRIIDGRFYIVSGPGNILELSFAKDKFVVEHKYAVPPEYFSMNDMIYFQGYFWISVYQNREYEKMPALLRLPSLNDFGTERCVDLYGTLGMKGIPYFFSWVDGKLCIPEIDTYSRIVLYDAKDGELKVNRVLYDFGKAELSDIVYSHRNDIDVREYILGTM